MFQNTKVEVSTQTLVRLFVALAAVWLLVKLWYVVVIVVIALVLVGTFRPIVAWLEAHKLPRFVALGLVFLAMLISIGLIGVLTVPVLVAQIIDIVEKAPGLQAGLAGEMRKSSILRPLAGSVRSFDLAGTFSGLGKNVLGWSQQAVILIGEGVTTFFLALYVMADREREQGALFALVPRRYHLRLARVLSSLEAIVGGYVRGQVITSVLIGLYTFGLLMAFGAPNAVAFGVLAALTDVIPFIGGLLATTPAVLSALTVGVTPALVVLGAMIIYQAFESRILVPRVYGRVLRLSPAVVIVSLLVGGTLMGLVGALLALPVAAGLRTLIKDLRLELPGEADLSVGMLSRDAAAERAYAEQTEGATATDAALIAGTILADRKSAGADVSSDPMASRPPSDA